MRNKWECVSVIARETRKLGKEEGQYKRYKGSVEEGREGERNEGKLVHYSIQYTFTQWKGKRFMPTISQPSKSIAAILRYKGYYKSHSQVARKAARV